MLVTDRNVLDSPELGIEIASALHKLYPQEYQLEHIATLLANGHILEQLTSGVAPAQIADEWTSSLEAFEAKRKLALLY